MSERIAELERDCSCPIEVVIQLAELQVMRDFHSDGSRCMDDQRYCTHDDHRGSWPVFSSASRGSSR